MAKKLAIEWDSQELRMVVAHQRGASVVVDQVLILPVASAEEGGGSLESRVSRVLKEQVAQHGLSKLPTLLGINRSTVELQVLTVPPVPDDELAEIVRFQAIREFSSIGEDGAVDFVKLRPAVDGRARVHAAAISGKQVKSSHKVLEHAQLQPQRFYLRPFAAAQLASSQSRLADKTFLLVDMLPDRVELTGVRSGEILLSRSTRVPGETDSEHYTQTLQGEVRRTILAARSKDAEAVITHLVILGQPLTPAAWRQVGDDLQLSVEFLDPLHAEHVSSSEETAAGVSGRIGALVGMLLADGSGNQATIDFLNPRRKPDPPDRRRLFLLSGLTAATVVLAIAYLLYSGIGAKDSEIARLKGEIADLQKSNKPLLQKEMDITQIDNWVQADVQWLDELYRMSDLLPSADEMIATRVHMQTSNNLGGTVALEGYVTDPSVISKLETSIRDERHQVLGRESKNQEYGDTYLWSFQEYVTVIPTEQDRFAPRIVAASPSSDSQMKGDATSSSLMDLPATEAEGIPAESVKEPAPGDPDEDTERVRAGPSAVEEVAKPEDDASLRTSENPEPAPDAKPIQEPPAAAEAEAVRTQPQQKVANPSREQPS